MFDASGGTGIRWRADNLIGPFTLKPKKEQEPAPTRKELEAWAIKHDAQIYLDQEGGWYVVTQQGLDGPSRATVYLALLACWRLRKDLR